MKHDYAAAYNDMLKEMSFEDWAMRHAHTVEHALRFADKMMQEPSEAMVGLAENAELDVTAYGEAEHSTNDVYRAIFKAMRDQALKEIEG